jgi:hypothetical protein
MALNALGAIATSVALVIIIFAKFIEGAWLTFIIVPGLIVLFQGIKRHYQRTAREVDQPVQLNTEDLQPPIVIIPIECWNRVAERAVRFGLQISDDVTAIHVRTEKGDDQRLRKLWAENVEEPARTAKSAVPSLETLYSPYRQIYQPILDFVNKTKRKNPDRTIAVVIPELVESNWYEYLLHIQHGAGLKALLYLKGEQSVVVINTPWYLHEE